MAADSFSYDTFLNDLDNFSFNSDKNTTPDVLDLYTNPQATEPEERGEEGEDEQASVQDDRLSQFKRQIVHQHKSFSQAQLPTPAQSGEFYATSPDDVLMSPLTMPVSGGFEGLDEEDMILLTPLLSPAMTPSYPFSHLSIPGSAQLENFSPLTSPALHPTADTPTSTRTVFTKRSARNVDPRIKSPLAGSVSKRARNSANPVTVLSSATVPPHSEQDCQQAALPTNKADAIAEGTSAHATVPPTPTLHQLNSVDRTSDLPSLRTSSSPLVRPVQPDPATVAMPPPPSPATALAPVTPASLMKLSPSSVAVTPVPHSSAAAAATLPLLVSPALGPITPGNPILLPLLSSPMLGPSSMLAPAILGSPEGIRPTADRRLVSPNLKPKVSSQEAADRLATKSNYRILADGETASTGLNYSTDLRTGATQRRTSHKAAEQKRRDHLRKHFDDLRAVLPDLQEKGGSKVYLLKKSYDFILHLKSQNTIKDIRAEALASEVAELRKRLGLPPFEEEEPELDLGSKVKQEVIDVDAIKEEVDEEEQMSMEDRGEKELGASAESGCRDMMEDDT